MFGDEELFDLEEEYRFKERIENRILSFFLPSILLLNLIRSLICEVNLLQLSPSNYIFLIFLTITYLSSLSSSFVGIPLEFDSKRDVGGKGLPRLTSLILRRSSLYFLAFILIFLFFSVLPASLDAFNDSGEPSLENLWSINQVILLEATLLILLGTLSQSPIYFLIKCRNEERRNGLPTNTKKFIFFVFVGAGILTPTVDSSTQITFAISILSLFLLVFYFLFKRGRIRVSLESSLGF
jgi:hypothetical protein